MNWFYESGGQPQGPVPDNELDRLVAEGKVSAETRVWHEGMADWRPLHEARPPEAAPASPVPGVPLITCASCGKAFPSAEIVQIAGHPICAACKPAVLQNLQQGIPLPSASLGRTGPPWENRATIGLWRAISETVSGVLTRPGVTFETMRRDGGIATPFLYFLLLAVIGSGIEAVSDHLIAGKIRQVFMPGNTPPPAGMEDWMKMSQNPLFVVVVLAVWIPLTPFVLAGLIHLFLLLYNGARAGFETTFRTFCYVWGSTFIFCIVPACGVYVHMIWGLVALCLALGPAHETTTEKAVGAVLSPVVLCCGALIVGYGALIAVVMQAAKPH